jgi:oligopeptide transport system substrate-binding protein
VVLARRLLTWTTLSIVVFGTTACTLIGGEGDDLPDGVVAVGITRPAHLLPSAVSDGSGAQVLAALFTPLVRYDAEHRPVPAAATSVTSPDNRVWTIKLADGYTFHNGEKVTAQRYVDAWNYAAYGPNKQRNSYLFERVDGFAELQGAPPAAKGLSGLRTVDDRTLTVTLSAPFVDFPAMLGHQAFYPLPTAAFASPGVLAAGFENDVVGQGPFRLTGGWAHGDRIDVRRYDAAVTPPKVAGVRFRVYDDLAAAYTDLVDDRLDVLNGIPAEKLTDAAEKLGGRLATGPGSSLTMLAFPAYQDGFAEPAVRRAISMAIDRDRIVATLFSRAQQPARAFVPPLVVGYRPDACGPGCGYDPVAARAAYQQAGGPATLTISYNADGGHKEWVDATCAQLAANLGITCTGAAEPTFETMLGKVRRSEPLGLFRMTWFMEYPSMESYLGPLFTSDGSSNFEGYRSPDLDGALKAATSSPNQAAAVAGYRKAEAVLARDMPVIPLRYGQNTTGRSTRVGAVTLDVFDRIDLTTLAPV